MRSTLILATFLATAACTEAGLIHDDSTLTAEDLANRPPITSIDFGDDSGDFADDGECDDPRFRGQGMTATPLMHDDIKRDASDCRAAYRNKQITLQDEQPA